MLLLTLLLCLFSQPWAEMDFKVDFGRDISSQLPRTLPLQHAHSSSYNGLPLSTGLLPICVFMCFTWCVMQRGQLPHCLSKAVPKKIFHASRKDNISAFHTRVERFCRADLSRTRSVLLGLRVHEEILEQVIWPLLPFRSLIQAYFLWYCHQEPLGSEKHFVPCEIYKISCRMIRRDNRVYVKQSVQYCPCHTHHKSEECACVCARVLGLNFSGLGGTGNPGAYHLNNRLRGEF